MVLPRQACQCLDDFEAMWPGLLYDRLGWLFLLLEEEATHVAQSYALLFSAVLHNYIHVVVRLPVADARSCQPYTGSHTTRHVKLLTCWQVPITEGPLPPFLAMTNKGTFVAPDHVRSGTLPIEDRPPFEPSAPWLDVSSHD